VSPIIDLQKRLVEVARLRIGKRGKNGAPQKIDTFRATSRDRARMEEFASNYGGTVEPWEERPGEFEVISTTSELPILLLPGQALSQWYELWSAGGCQRRCDGVTDVISDGPCVCDTERGERKCKPTTRLSVMLPEIPGLGVWRLESHGYYAAVELSATAGMLEQATARGQMFPARLRIDQRSQVKDGKTTRYAVPVIDIDVRLPEALGAAPLSQTQPLAYKPIAELERGGVNVADGLDAVARESAARIPNGRSAAPLGPAADIEFGEPAPIPVDESPSIDAPTEDKATAAQKKKLDVLVGKLRDKTGAITTDQLWHRLAKMRGFEYEQMIELLEGRDEVRVLHWAPLRESLTKPEATELIDRLTQLEAKVAA
jgi:hypothetical protein